VTTTAIGLMAAYGISQTPLFFRYKNVSELPSSWFRTRKTIRGRLISVRVVKVDREASQPIQCQVRHASPVESILPTSWYNQLMKWHPSTSTLGLRPDEREDELLQVEIAGIRSFSMPTPEKADSSQVLSTLAPSAPSSSSLLAAMDPSMVHGVSSSTDNNDKNNSALDSSALSSTSFQSQETPLPSELEWLHQFAKERPFISCQLLGRRVPILSLEEDNTSHSKKRRIPDFFQDADEHETESRAVDLNDPLAPQLAICRLYYRSSSSVTDYLWQLVFPVDMAKSMVQMGRATVVSDGEGLVTNDTINKSAAQSTHRLADTTNTVKDLQADVHYLEQLHKAEHQAVAEQRGMWQKASIREQRVDIVQEVEFQQHAPWYQKLWRWMRGG